MHAERRATRRLLLLACASVMVPGVSGAQAVPASHGWTPIFDARSLAGWSGGSAFTVDDGALVARATGAAGALCTEKRYADFTLRFRFRTRDTLSHAVVLFRADRGRVPETGSDVHPQAAPTTVAG